MKQMTKISQVSQVTQVTKMNPVLRLAALALALSCAASAASQAGTGSSAGLPGPAGSIWCEKNGGKVLAYADDHGVSVQVCEIDYADIEVQTFYKATGGSGAAEPTKATQAFIKHKASSRAQGGEGNAGIANPASVYCGHAGGKTVDLNNAQGAAGYCVFSDNSMIDEWTLFRGPKANGQTRLAALLTAAQH